MRCDVVLQGGLAPEADHRHGRRLRRRKQGRRCSTSARRRSRTRQRRRAYPCKDPKKNWIKVLDKELGGAGSKFPGQVVGGEEHAQRVREDGQEVRRQGSVSGLVGHLADESRLERRPPVGPVLRALRAVPQGTRAERAQAGTHAGRIPAPAPSSNRARPRHRSPAPRPPRRAVSPESVDDGAARPDAPCDVVPEPVGDHADTLPTAGQVEDVQPQPGEPGRACRAASPRWAVRPRPGAGRSSPSGPCPCRRTAPEPGHGRGRRSPGPRSGPSASRPRPPSGAVDHQQPSTVRDVTDHPDRVRQLKAGRHLEPVHPVGGAEVLPCVGRGHAGSPHDGARNQHLARLQVHVAGIHAVDGGGEHHRHAQVLELAPSHARSTSPRRTAGGAARPRRG